VSAVEERTSEAKARYVPDGRSKSLGAKAEVYSLTASMSGKRGLAEWFWRSRKRETVFMQHIFMQKPSTIHDSQEKTMYREASEASW
jgi:hypothetical protein